MQVGGYNAWREAESRRGSKSSKGELRNSIVKGTRSKASSWKRRSTTRRRIEKSCGACSPRAREGKVEVRRRTCESSIDWKRSGSYGVETTRKVENIGRIIVRVGQSRGRGEKKTRASRDWGTRSRIKEENKRGKTKSKRTRSWTTKENGTSLSRARKTSRKRANRVITNYRRRGSSKKREIGKAIKALGIKESWRRSRSRSWAPTNWRVAEKTWALIESRPLKISWGICHWGWGFHLGKIIGEDAENATRNVKLNEKRDGWTKKIIPWRDGKSKKITCIIVEWWKREIEIRKGSSSERIHLIARGSSEPSSTNTSELSGSPYKRWLIHSKLNWTCKC